MDSISRRTRIGAGGRIVIPEEMRRALGVKKGETVVLECDETGLHVRSVRQAVKLAQQTVAKYVKGGRSLSAELIAERRREAEREYSRFPDPTPVVLLAHSIRNRSPSRGPYPRLLSRRQRRKKPRGRAPAGVRIELLR